MYWEMNGTSSYKVMQSIPFVPRSYPETTSNFLSLTNEPILKSFLSGQGGISNFLSFFFFGIFLFQ